MTREHLLAVDAAALAVGRAVHLSRGLLRELQEPGCILGDDAGEMSQAYAVAAVRATAADIKAAGETLDSLLTLPTRSALAAAISASATVRLVTLCGFSHGSYVEAAADMAGQVARRLHAAAAVVEGGTPWERAAAFAEADIQAMFIEAEWDKFHALYRQEIAGALRTMPEATTPADVPVAPAEKWISGKEAAAIAGISAGALGRQAGPAGSGKTFTDNGGKDRKRLYLTESVIEYVKGRNADAKRPPEESTADIIRKLKAAGL